ncbi:LysE family translocator [Cesiribacter sp. SM1]|uniref:LysE family translocator n=1 Tax=Cesiribacter sp. SM1 TaxID=2861196 RepID=UPI001CD51075|nr:LysE family translocator [Cesiribacter sp. SM1]
MTLLSALGYGVICGLGLAFMIGPVFFALIQTSIEKGFTSGASMAVGIALSDAIYVLIASLGVAVLANSPQFQAWLGLIGGIIMVSFGIGNIQRKIEANRAKAASGAASNSFVQIGKGFLLNGINPFVLIFWFGVGVAVINYDLQQKVLFFGGSLLTVLLTDFLKAYLANKLSHWLTPTFMNRMNKLVGVALIIFSIKLFYFAYEVFTL